MDINRLLKDIQVGIYNQIRYGNDPKYLYCSYAVAEILKELMQRTNCNEDGKCYVMGLEIRPTRSDSSSYFVR